MTKTLASAAERALAATTAAGRLKEALILLARLRESPLALLGAVLVFLMAVAAVFAPYLATHDPVAQDISNQLAPPSLEHFLGADHLGRDIWSRLVWGARVSMEVGFISVGFGMALGIPLGAIAGYYGGRIDQVLMRLMDAFLAFPGILMALTIVAILGVSLTNTMLAIGVVYIPRFARLIRSSVLTERNLEYVEACRSVGQSEILILFTQVLPNCLSPLLVQTSVFFAFAVVTEASLSYLGLGNPPPNPSWGLMLNEARTFMEDFPRLAIVPGLAISFATLGFNLFGDGLRDILDPKTYD